jgi:hypothetical protein
MGDILVGFLAIVGLLSIVVAVFTWWLVTTDQKGRG